MTVLGPPIASARPCRRFEPPAMFGTRRIAAAGYGGPNMVHSLRPRESRQDSTVEALRQVILPLGGSPADYDPLLAQIGEARLVLLGEASHGTKEFYRERAVITRRLIEEKG